MFNINTHFQQKYYFFKYSFEKNIELQKKQPYNMFGFCDINHYL